MIAQDIGFTRDFLKERCIHDYDRLKKISCGTNGQARAGEIHELSGLKAGHHHHTDADSAHGDDCFQVLDDFGRGGAADRLQ